MPKKEVHCADLIGIVLLRTMVHRVCLILHDDCSVHVTEDQILKRVVTSDDRDQHLPFLRECSKGDHCLELRRDSNIGSLHACISTKDFVKVNLGVGIHSDAPI